MDDIQLHATPYCGVHHFEERQLGEWHEKPRCIGFDVQKGNTGLTVLNFDNSIDVRTTAIGAYYAKPIYKDYVSVGGMAGYITRGYSSNLLAMPFVRGEVGRLRVDLGYMPIKGNPVVFAVKFKVWSK